LTSLHFTSLTEGHRGDTWVGSVSVGVSVSVLVQPNRHDRDARTFCAGVNLVGLERLLTLRTAVRAKERERERDSELGSVRSIGVGGALLKNVFLWADTSRERELL